MFMRESSGRYPRPKRTTAAEHGSELAAKQRRLKLEAAERRAAVDGRDDPARSKHPAPGSRRPVTEDSERATDRATRLDDEPTRPATDDGAGHSATGQQEADADRARQVERARTARDDLPRRGRD